MDDDRKREFPSELDLREESDPLHTLLFFGDDPVRVMRKIIQPAFPDRNHSFRKPTDIPEFPDRHRHHFLVPDLIEDMRMNTDARPHGQIPFRACHRPATLRKIRPDGDQTLNAGRTCSLDHQIPIPVESRIMNMCVHVYHIRFSFTAITRYLFPSLSMKIKRPGLF